MQIKVADILSSKGAWLSTCANANFRATSGNSEVARRGDGGGSDFHCAPHASPSAA